MSDSRIPVYLITGFLDSGKTTLLTDTLNMDYFNDGQRTVLLMCEDGEIEADDKERKIIVRRHVANQGETFDERIIHVRTNGSGHGGGDAGIMEDFSASLTESGESRSSISKSVESHLMACAIEESRVTGKMVDMEDFRRKLSN